VHIKLHLNQLTELEKAENAQQIEYLRSKFEFFSGAGQTLPQWGGPPHPTRVWVFGARPPPYPVTNPGSATAVTILEYGKSE